MATEKTVKVSLSEFDSMRDELKTLHAENKKLRAKVAGVEKALKAEPEATQTVTMPLPDDEFVFRTPFSSYSYSPVFPR